MVPDAGEVSTFSQIIPPSRKRTVTDLTDMVERVGELLERLGYTCDQYTIIEAVLDILEMLLNNDGVCDVRVVNMCLSTILGKGAGSNVRSIAHSNILMAEIYRPYRTTISLVGMGYIEDYSIRYPNLYITGISI